MKNTLDSFAAQNGTEKKVFRDRIALITMDVFVAQLGGSFPVE